MKKESLKEMLRKGYWGKKYDHYAYIFNDRSEKVAEYEWSYFLNVRNKFYKEMR